MDWLAILRRSGGIDAVARQVGQSPVNGLAATEALLPTLVDGLRDFAQREGGGDAGIRALLAMIDRLGNGSLAAEVMGPGPLTANAGDTILEQTLPPTTSKVGLASDAAAAGQLDAAMLERMLPVLAMLLCGYISARAGVDDAQGGGISWLQDALGLEDEGQRHRNSGSRR
jgi:hypothetical protein